jgi:hypothetical protein
VDDGVPRRGEIEDGLKTPKKMVSRYEKGKVDDATVAIDGTNDIYLVGGFFCNCPAIEPI